MGSLFARLVKCIKYFLITIRYDICSLTGNDESWVWFWTLEDEEPFVGDQFIDVPTPMGMPAVFYRSSSSYVELFKAIANEFVLQN